MASGCNIIFYIILYIYYILYYILYDIENLHPTFSQVLNIIQEEGGGPYHRGGPTQNLPKVLPDAVLSFLALLQHKSQICLGRTTYN